MTIAHVHLSGHRSDVANALSNPGAGPFKVGEAQPCAEGKAEGPGHLQPPECALLVLRPCCGFMHNFEL